LRHTSQYVLEQEKKMQKGLTLSLYGLLVAAIAGCTGTTVRPSTTQQVVPKSYTEAVISEITGSDELWHNYTVEIRRELISTLTASQAFTQVSDSTPTPSTNVVIVKGQITEVEKGSAAARWIVGFGAGRAHITADFHLTDSNGASLADYSVRKTYAGGAGIGGAGFLDMDDLAQKLGKEAADSLAEWAKTGKFAAR
jgi:hypothetical protein